MLKHKFKTHSLWTKGCFPPSDKQMESGMLPSVLLLLVLLAQA